MRTAASKLMNLPDMQRARAQLRAAGRTLVFTNGCFDLLHAGHVSYLEFARRQGDALLVGVNSDESVRRLKGPARPVNPAAQRTLVLAALECVDYVVVFGEDEPAELIRAVTPDVLVKGADWAHYVSGRDWVEQHGGRVALAPLVEGLSSTRMIERMREN